MTAASYEHAKQLQRDAQNWTNHYLPELLLQSFDEISKNGEFNYIDKVEIEIPGLPWQLTDAEWKEKIVKQISQHRISSLPVEVIIKQWLIFLKNGVFERNAFIGDIKEFEIFLFSVKSKISQSDVESLNEVFLSVNVVKRLFYVHSAKLVQFVLSNVFQVNEKKSEQVYRVIQNQISQNPVKTIEIVKYIIRHIQQNKIHVKDKLLEMLLQNPNSQQIEEIMYREKPQWEKLEFEKEVTDKDVFLNCPNAGLVILLPFIKRFFENIYLIKGDAFVDEISKLKALQALHFLATGSEVENEQDLLLPKILCGFETAEFIEFNGDLDEPTKNEANELLKSVIEHWEVLKSTSVDSLRETFLKRDGQLKIESNFLLQVSNSGVDVLLDKIPWGFRNFKLPWMKKAIITEWY
jgi:hypothetical protein